MATMRARNQPSAVGVGIRRATAARWAASPILLREGEGGFDTTNRVLKFGDGLHLWPELPVYSTPVQPSTGEPTDDDYPDLIVLAEAASL